jgi:hypothetical protein
MNLYQRDFSELTTEEYTEWQLLREQEVVDKLGDLEIRRSRFRDYPKAARHFITLFPNQYLDIVELKNESLLRKTLNDFQLLLDNAETNERDILNFIKNKEAYFIVGSILKRYYSFGHHDAFLFPEFTLGTSFKVDYLLIGRSSDGWSFVFVEFESPNDNITLSNGELGSAFRKGLNQVADWKCWLEANFSSLREVFDKCKNAKESLPSEFISLDITRIHFAVIAGRRSDFLDKTYRARRTRQRDNTELILHYDNVIDATQDTIGRETY